MSENSTTPTNDESLDWMRRIQSQQRTCAEEQGSLRQLWKQAKAAGENLVAMRRAIQASKLAPEEAILTERETLRLMALRNMPVIQTTHEIFDTHISESSRSEQDRWEIEQAGYQAGYRGGSVDDCPHPFGSDYQDHWERWRQKGAAAKARELGPDAEQADARKARPKRERQTRLSGTEHVQRKIPGPKRKAASGSNGRRVHRKRASPAEASDGTQVY